MITRKTSRPLIGMAVASVAIAGMASAQITQDFESSTLDSTTPPAGWSYIIVDADPQAGYVTKAGNGGGLGGQVTGNNAANGNETVGAYLVNSGGVAFDATKPITGSFDFRITDIGNYSNVQFLFGDIQTGISENTAGEFLGVKLMKNTFGNRGGVVNGAGAGVATDTTQSLSANTWYTATFSWTPTSGTAGVFSYTANSITSTITSTYTFDSPQLWFGFGAAGYFGDDTLGTFDNISINGTPFTGVYWDTNDTTAGAGNPASGTWDSSLTRWNPTADGTAATVAWPPGSVAVFAADSDATDPYTVTVSGTQDFSGLKFENGTPTLTGGTLRMTSDSFAQLNPGLSATIASAITDDGTARVLNAGGAGTLILSGDNSGATVSSMTFDDAIIRFDASNSLLGTGENLTINSSGTMAFGAGFGAGNIPTALDRVVIASTGTIAADNHDSTNFDLNTPGLAGIYFGAVGAVNYSGTLTPNGTTYRLGGGGGTLTLANTNALTGAGNSATIRGNVTLAAANDLDGGAVLSSGSSLTVGNSGSLGAGTLTISGLATVSAQGTVAVANPVAANADFNIGGTGTLSLGTVTVNNNRIITNNNSIGTTTLGTIGVTSGNRNLTFGGSGTTVVSGNISQGTGSVSVAGGTLVLSGSHAGSGTISLQAATLQLNSDSNGGLPSGALTISQNAGVLQAINADRAIANDVSLSSSPTISGSQSLTINGTMTVNNNRTLTNSISGTGKILTLSNITRDGANNRNLAFSGNGDTHVNGTLVLGSGTLTKNGNGTLALNHTNTYTGTTTVNNGGTLLVNGNSSASTGNVTVNNTATLGGTGTIGGNVTVTASANLAPGASAGTLAIGGNLAISAMAGGAGLLKFELDTIAASDKITVGGTLTIGNGTLGLSDFDLTNLGGLQNGTYTLISSGGLNGGDSLNASDVDGTLGLATIQLQISGNNVVLDVTGLGGGSAYDTWKAANAPGSNPDDDTDGDGVSNAVEFVLGGTSATKDLDKLPTVGTGGGNLTFTFIRDQDSIDASTTVTIEVSTDLATWPNSYTVPDSDTGGVVNPGVTVASGVGTDTVTLTVEQSPDTRKFARLKVAITP